MYQIDYSGRKRSPQVLPRNFKIYNWADLHVGNIGYEESTLDDWIHLLTSGKNVFGTLMGDIMECTPHLHKNFSFEETDGRYNTAGKQREYVMDKLLPISHKILWYGLGNHELRFVNTENFSSSIARDLDVPYADYQVKVLMPGGWNMFDWHGWGSCNPSQDIPAHIRRQRVENFVCRKMVGQEQSCRAMIMHHIHRIHVIPPTAAPSLTTNNERRVFDYSSKIVTDADGREQFVPQNERWFASSGAGFDSCKLGAVTYAERLGLPPTELGCLKIEVKNDQLYKMKPHIFKI